MIYPLSEKELFYNLSEGKKKGYHTKPRRVSGLSYRGEGKRSVRKWPKLALPVEKRGGNLPLKEDDTFKGKEPPRREKGGSRGELKTSHWGVPGGGEGVVSVDPSKRKRVLQRKDLKSP